MIARRQSYHGNTLGALAVGGNRRRRKQFEPLLIESTHVSPCYAYRGQARRRNRERVRPARSRTSWKRRSCGSGADSVVAFVAETVVGATLGAVPPVPGYFKRIREICDRYGVLLILDEVMCGMGRTRRAVRLRGGRHRARYHRGRQGPRRGLPADRRAARRREGSRRDRGGQRILPARPHLSWATPLRARPRSRCRSACASAICSPTCAAWAACCESALRAAFGNHPHVGDIRGRGLFLALELVEDRATKEPFDPALQLAARVKREAMEHGLICYPMGGTLDGVRGDHVMLAPPFIIEEPQLDELVEKLAARACRDAREKGSGPFFFEQ